MWWVIGGMGGGVGVRGSRRHTGRVGVNCHFADWLMGGNGVVGWWGGVGWVLVTEDGQMFSAQTWAPSAVGGEGDTRV